MVQVLQSLDFIILSKEDKVLVKKRKKRDEAGKLSLIGGTQKAGESFSDAQSRILKEILNLDAKIKDGKVNIKGIGEFLLTQSKVYDGSKKWPGNTTVFAIQTEMNDSDLLEKFGDSETVLIDRNKLPPLAFDQNNFVKDYFFNIRGYTTATIQKIGITIDLVVFSIKDGLLKTLLYKRSKEPFKDAYCVPGGFIDNSHSIEDNAHFVLERNTGIKGAYLHQLEVFGDLERDPRGRVISITYYALVDPTDFQLSENLKYDDSDWVSLSQIEKMKIGFDHKNIIHKAIDALKKHVEYGKIAFELLPEKFTLGELQDVYEKILDTELDKRNFRKKILELDLVEELDEYKKVGRMRPAKYHKLKKK